IADALKLVTKEDIVPARADKIVYVLAPMLAIVPALLTFLVVPFGDQTTFFGLLKQPTNMAISDLNIGILYILAISSVGIYGIMLGGWSSNSKYPLLGALRAAAQIVSYEVPLTLALVGPLLLANTLSMKGIVEAQSKGMWFIIPQFVAFLVYMVCAVAETNRAPFDLPEAEQELVAGFHTEYSGMKFAFFYLAEYANMIVVSAIATVVFLGGWLPVPGLAFLPIPAIVWFALKLSFFLFIFLWLRATYPRYRYDQLMAIGWKFFIPVALINIFVTALLVL
ncbi:MAG: NADH-quinone oxidoreductase subunit NuoH, partial [Holophagae bacterium]|nr:NADH-quinone oxidoreductase subunit NuoH [Holophagae bacterium]